MSRRRSFEKFDVLSSLRHLSSFFMLLTYIAEIRSYREAADALMHPIEALNALKGERKRAARNSDNKRRGTGGREVLDEYFDEQRDDNYDERKGASNVRVKGKGRAAEEGENCALS